MNQVNIEFYVNNFNFINSVEETDVSFISPVLRRRLSKVDKCALSVLNNVYSEEVQNLVFSSEKGEVERLIKIINQYSTDGEVSPSTFSCSVHNYSAGFFLLSKQKAIPYTAISACQKSISAGFLAAVTSKYDNILFYYADIFDDNVLAFGVNISKLNGIDKYRITLNNSGKKDDFEDFSDLFNKKIKSIQTSMFKLERI